MGSYRLRRTAALAACALATLGLGACRSSGAREPAVLAVSGPRVHPADELAVAARLPDDCLLYVTTDDVAGFFEAMGRDGIARRFAEPWEQAVFEVVRETGIDPMSLGGLEEIGVDVRGELSFAILPGRGPVAAIGVTLADPERFKVALYRAMPGGRQRPRVRQDVVLVGDEDVTIAIDGHLAIVVVGDRADRHAEALALRDPQASLARHRPFRVAMRQLKSPSLLRGWLDPRGLAYAVSGLDPRWAGASYGEAMADIAAGSRRALEAARARGASAEELVAIDEHFAMAQDQLRDDPEASQLRQLIGGVNGAALALDVTEDGVRARVRIDADEGALLERLWRNRSGLSELVGALDRAPLFVVAVSVDPEAVQEALPLLGLGDEVPEVLAALTGGLPGGGGEDGGAGAGLGELLTGEIELAVMPSEEGSVDRLDGLEVGAILGVRDEKRLRQVLDDLSGIEGAPLARREDGWRLSPPELPALDVTLGGERLVLATHAALGERLATGTPGGFEPSRALSLIDRGGDALTVAFAAGLPIAATHRGMAMWSASAPARQTDASPPRSKAYEAKAAELAELERRIGEQMMAVEREERERVMQLVARLGYVATRLRTTAHGIELELRYQTAKGPLVDAVADVVTAGRGGGGRQMRRLQMMWAERDALEAELGGIVERERAGGEGR